MGTKISALTALTGANSDPLDLIPIVDTSAAATKSITRQELQTYNAGTLTTDVKVLDLSATWNAAGVTFTGLKFNATSTASAAASLIFDWQVGSASVLTLTKGGVLTGTGPSSGAFIIGSATQFRPGAISIGQSLGGASGGVAFASDAAGSTIVAGASNLGFHLSSGVVYGWGSSSISTSFDTALSRISAGVIGAGTGAAASFAGRIKLTSAIAAGVAVGSLNASPTTGEIQSVTDATAPAVGSAVAAGGAAKALVWWNGAQWTVIGV